jgi:hypothetical protein
MGVEVLFGSIYLLSAGLSVWSAGQLSTFLKRTPGISDNDALERFKSLARIQMYLALVVIVLMIAGILAGIAVIVRHGLAGLVVVLAANMLVFGLGLYHKRFETRTRSLAVSSDSLGRDYRRVCDTWVKKALPDF